MWWQRELVKGEYVVVVDCGCTRVDKNTVEVGACTRQVSGGRRGVQRIFPSSMVVKVGPESLVGRFPQAVSGQVEWDSQVFVLVNGGLEPLFTVLGEKVVGEKWNGEWDVRFWRTQVAVFERLVDDVQCSAAAGFFQVGGHTSDGIDFQVCAFAATELLGCFKGCQCVLREIAEESERVEPSGGEEVRFEVYVGACVACGRGACGWLVGSRNGLGVW